MKKDKSSKIQKAATTIADRCLSMRIRFLNRTVNAIYDDAYRDIGITAAQGNMLVAIVLNEGISPTILGQRLNIEKSTLSRNLDRMRKSDLIDVREPSSGRSLELMPTKKGHELLLEILPRWESGEAATRELLGEDESSNITEAVDQARAKLLKE